MGCPLITKYLSQIKGSLLPTIYLFIYYEIIEIPSTQVLLFLFCASSCIYKRQNIFPTTNKENNGNALKTKGQYKGTDNSLILIIVANTHWPDSE